MRLVGEGSGFGDWCQRWGHEIAFRVIFLLALPPPISRYKRACRKLFRLYQPQNNAKHDIASIRQEMVSHGPQPSVLCLHLLSRQ